MPDRREFLGAEQVVAEAISQHPERREEIEAIPAWVQPAHWHGARLELSAIDVSELRVVGKYRKVDYARQA